MNKNEILVKEQSFSKSNDVDTPSIEVHTRVELVRIIADFVIETFGIKPKTFEKLSTAKAAVALFPRLKFTRSTGDGTVSNVDFSFLTKYK